LYYRLVLVVPEVLRFLVVVVRLGVFFVADFTGVLPLLALTDVDLLAVLGAALVVVRGALLEAVGRLAVDDLVVAIASMRGAGFLAGIVARTCLTALVCCLSVMRNSWCPSRVATK
jgi:hypothetical protein